MTATTPGLVADRPPQAAPTPTPHRGLHNRVVAFRWRGVTVVNFGLLAALGGIAGSLVIIARQHQAGLAPERFLAPLYALLPLLVVAGSRLMSALLEGEPVLRAPWRLFRKHGYCFQGGFLLTVAGIAAIAAAYRVDLLLLLDTFALGLPLGHALGRLGCHTYGCCHGRPARPGARLAITYTNPESKAAWRAGLAGVPLHPTQLYSVAGNLALFAALALLATFPLVPGQLAAAWLVLGSVGRFEVELLRGVPTRRVADLSPFQLVALAMILAGVLLLILSAGGHAAPRFDALPFAAALDLALADAWILAWPTALFLLAFGLHRGRLGAAPPDEA